MNQAPLESTTYMIAGYAIFFVILATYITSLFIRWRRLKFEESMLQNKKED